MGLPSEQNLVSQIVEFGLNFLFLRDSNHKERFSIWTNKKQCLSDWANQVIWNSCSMFGIVAQWLDLLSDKDKIWNYILLKSGIQIKHLYIIYNLENTLPDFFSNSYEAKNNMNFYVRKPYVEPRRGLKFSDISNLQFITWRSKRTQRCFLPDDCKCNKCKVIKPPKISLVNECNEIISM